MLKKNAKEIAPEFYNPLKIFPGVVLNPNSQQAEPQRESYIVSQVYYRTPSYAIFEVNGSRDLEYVTVDDQRFTTQAISLQLNRIEFWLKDSQASKKNDGQFLETAADAIAQCFEGKKEDAVKTIVELETMIKNEVYHSSKMLYMIPYLILVGLMILGALYIHLSYCDTIVGCPNPHFALLFYLCSMGSIGGLLSVSRNLDAYNVEIKEKKSLWKSLNNKFLVSVLIRFTVSILGAVTLYIFLKCNFINVINVEKNPFIIYGLALIAGFSENLIPSLMTKFETNLIKGEPMRLNESIKPSVFPGNTTSPITFPSNILTPAIQSIAHTNISLDGMDEERDSG